MEGNIKNCRSVYYAAAMIIPYQYIGKENYALIDFIRRTLPKSIDFVA